MNRSTNDPVGRRESSAGPSGTSEHNAYDPLSDNVTSDQQGRGHQGGLEWQNREASRYGRSYYAVPGEPAAWAPYPGQAEYSGHPPQGGPGADYTAYPNDAQRRQWRGEEAAGRTVRRRRPWYNQGWVWSLVTLLVTGPLLAGLLLLADQVGRVSGALQEQTGVLREQNGLLVSIRDHLAGLESGVRHVAGMIREALDILQAQM
ncbi:hypothetical protein LJK88_49785 [Paenibacillus sp. P26]|nr:hypothetical protein LJK88_49785 [Paenibacillus sp. P26]